jgi:hypothetical protein
MTVGELIQLLENYEDDCQVIIMSPEMDHFLSYRITEVDYNRSLDLVVIDVQRNIT